MFRSPFTVVILAIATCISSFGAENTPTDIVTYFTGKQVTVKIDMPGSQKGVDLRFNKPVPMDWQEYSSRLKDFGPAIHKGDTSRITSIVVKKDMIEFQLDGGGYGTFGDDTTTTVQPKVLEKSDYEKQLEKQISETDDPDKKRQLQRDLDRERARRERQNAANRSDAHCQPDQSTKSGGQTLAGRIAIQLALVRIDPSRSTQRRSRHEAARGLCRLQRLAACRSGVLSRRARCSGCGAWDG
jgi:hypothetical protein